MQGPPGTGKTQFITALLRCLDAAGESARAFNRTLITSYQQDAVDNMVSKTRNRGLPPTRVDSDEERGRRSAQQLRAEIVQKVTQHTEGQRPEVAHLRQLRELQTLVAGYDEAPTVLGDLVGTLERAQALAAGALPPPLAERLARLRSQVRERNDAMQPLLLAQHAAAVRAARSLRGSSGGFADDGPDRAARAVGVLVAAQVLRDGDRDILERAAAWAQSEPPSFLANQPRSGSGCSSDSPATARLSHRCPRATRRSRSCCTRSWPPPRPSSELSRTAWTRCLPIT